jgi:DNA polymerase epsilon subunit 1
LSEFSEESTFREPCLTLELANLVCNECSQVTTHMDVLREQQWSCHNCRTPYDLSYMEDRICDWLERNVAFY